MFDFVGWFCGFICFDWFFGWCSGVVCLCLLWVVWFWSLLELLYLFCFWFRRVYFVLIVGFINGIGWSVLGEFVVFYVFGVDCVD